MKTFQPFHLTTPAGIRRVADYLDSLAADPANWQDRHHKHRVGRLTILPTYYALTEAAARLRKNARHHEARSCTAMETDVWKMDAVRHCGNPEDALATIRRQLEIQGESMEPADMKRCERAARLIENHIAQKQAEAAQAAQDAATLAQIEAGRVPTHEEVPEPGTPVKVVHLSRNYLGEITETRKGPHPILGKKYPTTLYTVNATHILETRGSRYAYFRTKCHMIRKIIPKDILLLTPCPH